MISFFSRILGRVRKTAWRDWILWANLVLLAFFWFSNRLSWRALPATWYLTLSFLVVLALGVSFLPRWRWVSAFLYTLAVTLQSVLLLAFQMGAVDDAAHLWVFTLAFLALYVPWPWNTLATALQILLFVVVASLFGYGPDLVETPGTLIGMVLLTGIFAALGYLVDRYRWTSSRLNEVLRSIDEQRRFLQDVIDAVQEPFYVIDVSNYRIMLANQAARRLGIREDASRLPPTCYALTHRRDAPCSGDEHPCPLQMVLQHGRPAQVEHIHYRDDGTPYIAEVHAYPVRDVHGHIRYMVEYSIDVTARKKAEERLRLLEKALEHSAHGVVITDRNGVIQYVNPAFTRTTGYTPEEVLGKTPRVLKSGRHSPEFYRHLWSTILSGKVWEGRIINRRKDGTLYYEEQTIAPVLDDNGRITHFVAVKQDVTQRIEMEKALEEARQRAEKASEFKSYIMAALGHDLRTPLQGILGYAELLLMQKDALPQDMQDMLEAVYRSAMQIRFFADDLLHYGRLEQAGLDLNPRPLPVARLREDLERVFGTFVQEKGLEFEYVVEEDFPETLHVDPTWFTRALMNLVGNAIKFTPPGGKVRVRFWRPDVRSWAVSVEDTGPGVPPEIQERIFEPFVTGERTTRGVGLGLYIVRSVVEAMGGTIEVENRPEGGARFVVRFPLNEETSKSLTPDSAAGNQGNEGR